MCEGRCECTRMGVRQPSPVLGGVLMQGAGPVLWVLAPSHGCWPHLTGSGPISWVLASSHGCWPRPMGVGPIPWVLNPSHGSWPHPTAAGPILQVLAPCCGCWPCPMGAGLNPWVLAPSHGCWTHPMGSCLVQWVLAPPHGCWPHPMGAGPISQMLAPPYRCWPCPVGAGPTKAVGALTKAPAAECLESLKKVRIPPSSTVQEELQFFLGSSRGVTQGDSTVPVPSAPPGLPSPVAGTPGCAYRSRFPLSTVLVRLSTPAFSRLLNWRVKREERGESGLPPALPGAGVGKRRCPSPGCSPSPP